MDRKWEERTGSFEVRTPDGKCVTINIFTTIIESRTRGGTERGEGSKRLVASDGRLVNVVEKGKYAFFDEEKNILTSNDPNAP